jgi:hypothetical protein
MTQTGVLGRPLYNGHKSASASSISLQLLLCIRHVYTTNVNKYFYSTITLCCVTCYGSSLWVKNHPFRRSSVDVIAACQWTENRLFHPVKPLTPYIVIPQLLNSEPKQLFGKNDWQKKKTYPNIELSRGQYSTRNSYFSAKETFNGNLAQGWQQSINDIYHGYIS